ncbi:RNA 2',3'-cyclic phosphodiesterase [Tessaracoccus caeni]|uniref:RNA 2',3'-cyclic phosphodiesterase n=1 Tax=Tessaracoccus caeni TaxID=3031239 RepID=UPI0023D9DCC0|nr:RNA 2',3'-cyclic phosphodiesterase [Tessaracoccus caeni]MDF1488548.1 RNA 2',3'-cyclic phosphodiesterase [Tessaracoccus caeni]
MFAAVLPPQEIVEEINRLLAPRREALPMLRWTRPEGWHLTTAFMEDVDEYRVEPLLDALGEVADHHAPFDLSVGGGYALPHPDTAKIIVLGVSRGSDELERLSVACRGAANRVGAKPDGRRFLGHLTLARHGRGFPSTKLLAVLDSLGEWAWRVDEFALMESHLSTKRYDVVARFPLKGADALS